jgi:hypothetical protein
MAKNQIETVPVSNVPNVSANDPANASLNDYSKMKIKKEQYKVKFFMDNVIFYIFGILLLFFKLKRKIFK